MIRRRFHLTFNTAKENIMILPEFLKHELLRKKKDNGIKSLKTQEKSYIKNFRFFK